jgi:hypothetical protein
MPRMSAPPPQLGALGNTVVAISLEILSITFLYREGMGHTICTCLQMLASGVSEENITTETEELTGVASSSRRRLSAEQDSRIGRTSSNERVSPRLTIPAVRMEIRLIEVSHRGGAHRQHERLRLRES